MILIGKCHKSAPGWINSKMDKVILSPMTALSKMLMWSIQVIRITCEGLLASTKKGNCGANARQSCHRLNYPLAFLLPLSPGGGPARLHDRHRYDCHHRR